MKLEQLNHIQDDDILLRHTILVLFFFFFYILKFDFSFSFFAVVCGAMRETGSESAKRQA